MRAVIFDFDGVVFDSETPLYNGWADAFQEYGADLEIDEWAMCIGTKNAIDPIKLLVDKVAKFDPVKASQILESGGKLNEAVYKNVSIALKGSPKLMPGVKSWLDRAIELDLKIGMASSSSLDWLEEHLSSLKIRHYFQVLVGADYPIKPKPSPDVYLKAIQDLEELPEDVFAVEDSPHGVNSAKRAGLRVVACPTHLTRYLNFDSADLIITRLDECSLDNVIELF